ncbi:MAG: hypothetical protein IJH65_03235 [Methanobrevibacter sp.]|nr:hypothetical protein [Methanobrevibacter sp.]
MRITRNTGNNTTVYHVNENHGNYHIRERDYHNVSVGPSFAYFVIAGMILFSLLIVFIVYPKGNSLEYYKEMIEIGSYAVIYIVFGIGNILTGGTLFRHILLNLFLVGPVLGTVLTRLLF